ncbi:MAG: hypothetical protein RKO66_20315 [Candidatus Contendobacter sp.]|nr:hypothetical protein [Candidatus Contendobacter sp.]MDS4058159.1 hypothetical protein [Candidatus Contendobacter sp.]
MNMSRPVLPLTLTSLLLLSTAQAQDSGVGHLSVRKEAGEPVVQTVSTLENEMIGRIDWDNKTVYAVGDGVPPTDAVNPAQARVRAKRAAIDEAMARLLETVKEVKVDAESTTRNFINENRTVQTRVSGLIKNATVAELRQASDGSYQIMMSMPMTGSEGLTASLLPTQMIRVQQAKTVTHVTHIPLNPPQTSAPSVPPAGQSTAARAQATPGVPSNEAPATLAPAPTIYTGLIVDARGLNPSPAAFPKLISQAGDVLYDLTIVDPNAATERGMCDYKKSLDVARQLPRTGKNPLVVKAVATSGTNQTDLVLDDETAKQVKSAETGAGFLRNAQVIVVVD